MKGFVVVNVSITSPISIRFRPGGYIRCSFILSRFANQSQCFALIKVWQLNLMIFPMDHFSVTYSDSCMILPSNLYLLLSIMHYVSPVSCWKLYDLRTDELITIAGRFFFSFSVISEFLLYSCNCILHLIIQIRKRTEFKFSCFSSLCSWFCYLLY